MSKSTSVYVQGKTSLLLGGTWYEKLEQTVNPLSLPQGISTLCLSAKEQLDYNFKRSNYLNSD